jgi:hypothetical protein
MIRALRLVRPGEWLITRRNPLYYDENPLMLTDEINGEGLKIGVLGGRMSNQHPNSVNFSVNYVDIIIYENSSTGRSNYLFGNNRSGTSADLR